MVTWACTERLPLWQGSRTAWAEDNTQPAWYRGVSAEEQGRARTLFSQAADLKAELLLTDAIAKYRAALRHWDNPEIRYELITVLARSAQAIEAWQELEILRQGWGIAALLPEDQAQVRDIEHTLLNDHLAVIEIHCDASGAEIALDGEHVFVGPGVYRAVVEASMHVVSAENEGYFPMTESMALAAGQQSTVTIEMSPDRLIQERYFTPSTPWLVTGAGAALVLLGVGLQWQAQRDFDRAEEVYRDQCEGMLMCEPDRPAPFGRAQSIRSISYWTLISGAATVLGGVTLLAVNRARTRRSENENDVQLDFAPILSEKALGLSVGYEF